MRHHGLNRQAVFGRRFDHAHVADAQHGHVQSARDGCRAHGEHVHVLAHLLESLLVADTETLFLVENQQAQIAELNILRKQPMRADGDVDLALRQLFHRYGKILLGHEAREHGDANRERGEAPLEGLEVLEGQHRGGCEHGHLFAIAQRLEGRTHGDFGFAEAHIAAE